MASLDSLAKWLSVYLQTKWLWVVALTINLDIAPVSSKEFLDIQATIECGFTQNGIRDMIGTYSLVL